MDVLNCCFEDTHITDPNRLSKMMALLTLVFAWDYRMGEVLHDRIIVDIQHVRYHDHYHRFLHYHCAAILEQAANANDYRAKAQVFTIVFLTSSDRYQKDITRIDFDPKDLQGRSLNEIQHQILYLVPGRN